MHNQIGPLVIIAVSALINFLGYCLLKLSRENKNNKDRASVWMNLNRNSLQAALSVCNLNPLIIKDASWDINNCVCDILFKRIAKQQSYEFNDDLTLYGNEEKVPQSLREEIAKTLEHNMANYARGEENQQQIIDLYTTAIKDGDRLVAKFIHNTVFLPGIILWPTKMASA